MSTFIAIELSDEIKETLAQIQSHLKYAGADVKWVEKNNIHLTLKFLGEIDEKKCEAVKTSLDEVSKSVKPFEISLKEIGAFPKIEFPRVVWVGLDKGAKESVELAGKIDKALTKIGFQEETRPFTAHLTIGRVRSPKNKEALKEKINSYDPTTLIPYTRPYTLHPTPYTQLIASCILFQSKLTSTGPTYTKLYEVKFN